MKARFYLLSAIMLLAASCGDSSNNGPEYLFVQTSSGASLTESTLTLTGISPNTGWFTDRPYREAGQIPTEEFLWLWTEGEDSFADNPPNADFTCTADGEVINHFLELRSPRLDGKDLVYEVRSLVGATSTAEPAVCTDAAHLFIDDLGNVCEQKPASCLETICPFYPKTPGCPDDW